MQIDELLYSVRAGEQQDVAAIDAFVDGVVSGSVSQAQAGAWLAWVFARGLSNEETMVLTRAMTESGKMFDWGAGPTVMDKHSTGGVGDKVSLVLAPLWAELGYRVPMVSGRGLGHTGGTLDKLESIPGYRCDLTEHEMQVLLAEVGCFITGQTAELAPADRILYALRNETCTVESIPLIVASILSKKLAEGLERLVLDVKTGSGAFMKERSQARELARALVDVASLSGVQCRAVLTDMSTPLGCEIGNGCEVKEAVECLQGGGPSDLREVTLTLAANERAAAVLDSGKAYERFARMVKGQGGDVRALERGEYRDPGTSEHVVEASRSGVIHQLEAIGFGRGCFVLGAGRRRASDAVDFGVGLTLHAKRGESVESGQPLVTVSHRDGRGLEQCLQQIEQSIDIRAEAMDAVPLVLEEITS